MKKIRNNQKEINLKKILSVFVFGAILIVLAFATVEMATSGAELGNLEKKIAEVSQENKDLSRELVKNSSLNSFSEEADLLGFQKPSEIVYITNTSGVASRLP